ncbi:MAG: hypothetical protein ACE5DY_04660 [Mariprofundaceae bacterium]
MNRLLTTLKLFSLASALMLAGIVAPNLSLADDGDDDDYHRRHHYSIQPNPAYHERRLHVPARHVYHHQYHPRAHARYNDGLGIGLGLAVGALFGYAISESANQHYYEHRQTTVVVPSSTVRVVQPRYITQRRSCLQTREYQTRIIIGGRGVEAYGTACLQADGSWKFGPATPVPAY